MLSKIVLMTIIRVLMLDIGILMSQDEVKACTGGTIHGTVSANKRI
jgi:hypothetical protein